MSVKMIWTIKRVTGVDYNLCGAESPLESMCMKVEVKVDLMRVTMQRVTTPCTM